MANRLDTLFWVAFAFFGFTTLAAGAVRVSGGDTTPSTLGQFLGGALVVAAATRAFLVGDAVTGDANDVSLLVRVLAVAGALVYVVGIGLQFL